MMHLGCKSLILGFLCEIQNNCDYYNYILRGTKHFSCRQVKGIVLLCNRLPGAKDSLNCVKFFYQQLSSTQRPLPVSGFICTTKTIPFLSDLHAQFLPNASANVAKC